MKGNSLTAVILQPAYLPWIGFFDLVHKADVFVIFDDAQFTIRDWRTRNRIRTNEGWIWLSVPVSLDKPYFEYLVKDVQISYEYDWTYKHLSTIKSFYKRSLFFDEVYSILEKHIPKRYKFLAELDNQLIFDICEYLGLSLSKFRFSSEMGIPKSAKKSERLIYMLDSLDVKASYYLSGITAKNYLDTSLFEDRGIKVLWHGYEHPYYNQNLWGTGVFISYLSILDILFNHGKEAMDIITGDKIIPIPEKVKIAMAEKSKNLKMHKEKVRL
ncbi:MAG: WbqC family protein [Nitrospirota bacterium]